MFNFPNYFSALFSSIRNFGNKEYDFNLKQFLLKIFLFVFFTVVVIINNLFFLFDEVFLFFYRFTKIEKPVMIIGVPRTGTTFLYHTIAEDKENFTCFTFGEIVFAPSLIQKYIYYGIYRFDKFLGGPLKKCLLYLETKTKIEYDKIHAYGYFKPEEDELMLLNIYSSIVLKYFFPLSTVFDKYIEFDEKVRPAEKSRIFNFQKRYIKKHLFFWKTIQGKQKTFLCKNPIHSPKINSLFEYFPDVRLIVTNRDLAEVIPSFVSMNASAIKNLHTTKLLYPNAVVARKVIINWQEQLTTKLKQKDPAQIYECTYDNLTNDIREVVCNIYNYYDLHMSEDFLKILGDKLQEQQNYKSNHHYNLSELIKALGEI